MQQPSQPTTMYTAHEPLGSYYDRPVLFHAHSRFDEIAMGKIDHSTVLLWLGDRNWDDAELERAITRFIDRGTLHLTIAGERSGDCFSVLMNTVRVLEGNFVTMLNVLSGLNIDEAVEEFLKHASPAESQTKQWRDYRLVLVGGSPAMCDAFDAAIARCIGVRA